jgi:LysR family glycine cleavage system transcriptional activator
VLGGEHTQQLARTIEPRCIRLRAENASRRVASLETVQTGSRPDAWRKQPVEIGDTAAADERDRPIQGAGSLLEQLRQLVVDSYAGRSGREFDQRAVDVEKQTTPGQSRLSRGCGSTPLRPDFLYPVQVRYPSVSCRTRLPLPMLGTARPTAEARIGHTRRERNSSVPSSLPPLTSLRAFEAAARLSSFTKAARELHVTPAAISHQIRGLEKFLGVTLFRRSSRRVTLTEQGQLAAEHLREGFDRLTRGVNALRGRERAGRLTVGATPSFATRWLVPRLSRLTRRYPGIELRLVTGTAPVDFDRDEVDVAIRFGRGGFDRVSAHALFGEYVTPVANPALLRAYTVRRPADLARMPFVHDDSMRRSGRPPTWAEWFRVARTRSVDTSRGLHFDDGHLALQAAAAGQGVALGRLVYAEADLASGALRMPFPEVLELDLHYYLLVPETRAGEPAIAAFREWLLPEAARFQRQLRQRLVDGRW